MWVLNNLFNSRRRTIVNGITITCLLIAIFSFCKNTFRTQNGRSRSVIGKQEAVRLAKEGVAKELRSGISLVEENYSLRKTRFMPDHYFFRAEARNASGQSYTFVMYVKLNGELIWLQSLDISADDEPSVQIGASPRGIEL